MLRELDYSRSSLADASQCGKWIKCGPIKMLQVDSKILNPKSKICNRTPTFAVLSSRLVREKVVSGAELNIPFLLA